MPASLEALSRADPEHAIEIADRVWWVGHVLPDDPFQCHVYLLEQGGQSVLFDPGSRLTFAHTLRKVSEVVPLAAIRWYVCHHQDPDIAASLPLIRELTTRSDAAVVTHWRAKALLRHYGLGLPFWLVDEHQWRLELEDRSLEFIFTPYAYFPGAFCSFDPRTGVLFSSDLFGGFTEQPQLVARDESHFEVIRPFHEHYMPSRDILGYALAQIERRPVRMIAAQHGSIIPEHLVGVMIEKLKNLDCGIYLLGRDDTDIRRLSELNRTLREITETMLLYRDFRDIATRLFAVVRRSLPVASIDYYAALPEGGVLSLKAESRFAGVVEDQLPYACTFVGRNRIEWESTHAEDPAMADHRLHPEGFCTQPTGSGGLEITLPLAHNGGGRIEAMAILRLSEQPRITAAVAQLISRMLEPLQVALEREVIYRTIDMERERAYQRSIRDPLTGLFTRFYLHDVMTRHLALEERGMAPPLALVMLDLDHFKQVNDRYGHGAGDQVLEQVARLIQADCRGVDVPVRVGGEEFLVLLTGQDLTDASRFAERLRAVIAAHRFEAGTGQPLRLTVSIGLAARAPGESLEALRHRADTALYAAKDGGRDRCCTAAETAGPTQTAAQTDQTAA